MKKYFRSILSIFGLVFFGVVSAFSFPSQVENVQVQLAGEDSVRVTWEEAESTEDIIIGYRVYFGTTSVQEVGATYDDEIMVSGGIETVIENLLPGTTYYFAVTALDSEENESENYSVEVEFTIPKDEEVIVPPKEEEKEPEVVTPIEEPKKVDCEAFPEKLTNCEEYECTFKHPLTKEVLTRTISGIVDDTCRYKETMLQKEWMECRYPLEKLESMGQYYSDIAEGKDTENLLQKVLEEKQCMILSVGMVFPESEITSKPEEKEVLPEKKIEPIQEPEQMKPVAPDIIPPIEAMNLTVNTDRIASDAIAELSWDKSIDLENDVVDQILYVKEGLGSWDSGYSIGKEINTIELDIKVGKNYEYKIVTVDASGNRSESSVYSFTTKLAQSGPAGMAGIFIAILLVGIFGLYSSRRRA